MTAQNHLVSQSMDAPTVTAMVYRLEYFPLQTQAKVENELSIMKDMLADSRRLNLSKAWSSEPYPSVDCTRKRRFSFLIANIISMGGCSVLFMHPKFCCQSSYLCQFARLILAPFKKRSLLIMLNKIQSFADNLYFRSSLMSLEFSPKFYLSKLKN